MKRAVIVAITIAIVASAASAQGWMPGPGGWAAPTAPAETVKVEGKLSLVNASPAVVVKDKTYYVGIPARLYSFVDGFKEGASVKLEGYEYPLPYATNVSMLYVVKLTIGGREIDLSQAQAFGRGMPGAYCAPAPRGRGRW